MTTKTITQRAVHERDLGDLLVEAAKTGMSVGTTCANCGRPLPEVRDIGAIVRRGSEVQLICIQAQCLSVGDRR